MQRGDHRRRAAHAPMDLERARVVLGGIVERPEELPDDAEHVVQRARGDVVGAERRLAALERARQRVAGAGAVARVEERETAQAPELHEQQVERVAAGQRGRQRVGAIERARGVGVLTEGEQRLGANAQHVRRVDARLALLGKECDRRLAGPRGGRRELAGSQRRDGVIGELQPAVLWLDAHMPVLRLLPAHELRGLAHADDPHRHARGDGVCGHVLRDDRRGAEHAVVADRDAAQDRTP